MATDLYLPPNVLREKWAEEVLPKADWFAKALRDFDERLKLVWVPEGVDVSGLMPGRWHVKWTNEQFDNYIPIAGPNGEYIEPHSGVLEELRKRDLWNRNVADDLIRDRQRNEREVEHRRSLSNEQAKDTVMEDFKAAKRVAGETLDKKRWGQK